MSHCLCTFNANNLFLRYKFADTFPGDISGNSRISEDAEAAFGYLPLNNPGSFVVFKPEMRELAATALRQCGTKLPDVICFQEVESVTALRTFNERHLGSFYKYALVIDSRDLRQIDVGILTNLEIVAVRSRVDQRDSFGNGKSYLFSRDCLEVDLLLNKSGSKRVTLFINHLKSKLTFSAAERKRADAKRKRQAQAIMDAVQERFPGAAFGTQWFAVVGDMNDEPGSPPLAPLINHGLTNVLERIPNPQERWTHWYRGGNSVSQLDYIFFSPALDEATRGAVPAVERRGVGFANFLASGKPGPRRSRYHALDGDPNPIEVDFQFSRMPGITPDLLASDHCPVFIEIPS